MISEILPATLIPFALACIIMEITPGPNMGYLAIVSATIGRPAGFATTAGVGLGLLIIGIAAALGLAAIISNSPILYQTLRYTGIIYLLWLAWETWRGDPTNSATINNDHKFSPQVYRKYFLRGLITNLLNPKAGLFYVAVLPGFVNPASQITNQLIILSIIYVIIATTIHALIVCLAGTATQLLDNEKKNNMVRKILAIALAGIAIWFAYTTKL